MIFPYFKKHGRLYWENIVLEVILSTSTSSKLKFKLWFSYYLARLKILRLLILEIKVFALRPSIYHILPSKIVYEKVAE